MKKIPLLLLFLNLWLSSHVFGQIDNLHYIPPFFARTNVIDHYLVLSTLSTAPVNVTVTDGAGNPILNTVITYNTPQTINLGAGYGTTGILNESELNTVNREGMIVSSDAPIFVNVRHIHSWQGMSLTSKGAKTAAGRDFRSGHIVSNNKYKHVKAHFISFMALEDGTTVNVTEISNGVVFRNTPVTGGTSDDITVTLNANESYAIAAFLDDPLATNNINDVNGTRITSNKDIIVNTGTWLSGSEGNGRDIGADQIVPIQSLGDEYIFVEGNGNASTERPLIVANEDNTEVFVNGNPVAVATLNAGEYLFLPQTSYSANDNIHIQTTKNVYMYQSLSGTSTASTSLNFIPPLRCSGSLVVVIPSVNLIGNAEVSITARTGGVVTMNGAPLTVPALPVSGNPNWVTYTVPGGAGDVFVESDSVVNVALLNNAGPRGGAGYFSGFARFNEIDRGDTATFVICEDVTNTYVQYSLPSPYYSVDFDYLGSIHGTVEATGENGDTLFVRYTRPNQYFVGRDSVQVSVCKIIGCGGAIPDTICEFSMLIFDNESVITAGSGDSIVACDNLPEIMLDSLLTPDALPGGTWSDLSNTGALFGNVFQPQLVSPGIYEFSYLVSSGAFCKDSIIVKVNVLPMDDIQCCSLAPVFNINDVLCYGGNTGNISVTDLYANEFSLNNSGFTSTSLFENLSSGSYQLISKYGSACFDTAQIDISEPNELIASVNITSEISCFNECDGALNYTVSGGVQPYVFNLNTMSSQNNGVYSGLCAGDYRMFIQDSNSCSVQLDTQLLNPTQLLLNLDSTIDLSCGQNNGAIFVSANGGTITGAYDFSIISPASAASSNGSGNFTGLSNGTYKLQVSDDRLCIDTLSTLLNILAPPSIQIDSIKDNDCNGISSGKVFLTATGGVLPYQYKIDQLPYQSSNAFDQLSNGAHVAYLMDALGCLDSISFTISEPASLSLVSGPNITPPSCVGACDASVDIEVAGGVGPYDLSISGNFINDFTSSAVINNLCAGNNITVYVLDSNGCGLTTIINIDNPDSLKLGATVSAETCFESCDGNAVFMSTGGSGSYEYSHDFGSTWTNANTQSNLCTGVYTVLMRDGNNCRKSDTFSITGPSQFEIQIDTVINTSCGSFSGIVDVSVLGGDYAPYTLEINPIPQSVNNVVSHSFTGLEPNIYTIKATDSDGCAVEQTVGVSDNILTLGLNIIIEDVLCHGDSTGRVQVNANNGFAPYEYTVDDISNFGSSNIFDSLPQGTYTFAVKDNNGCIATSQATVNEPDVLSTLSQGNDLDCFGVCDGSVTFVNTKGGEGSYSYSLDSVNFQGGNTFSGLCAGGYKLYVRDGNNCTSTWYQDLNQASEILLNYTYDSVACNGGDNAYVFFDVMGGTGAYEYSIDNCLNKELTPGFFGLSAGIYDLCVNDANGCSVGTSLTINEPSPLNLTINGAVSDLNCFAECDGAFMVQMSGGTAPYSYTLDSLSFQSSPNFSNLCAGDYWVKGVDGNNCPVDNTAVIEVKEPAPLRISNLSITPSTCSDNNGSFSYVAVGGQPGYTYYLNNVSQGNVSNYTNLLSGTYDLRIEDVNNCSFDTTIQIDNAPEPEILNIIPSLPSCSYSSDGYLVVLAQGGTGALTYSLDNLTYSSMDTLHNLAKGTGYNVYVRDANMCVDSLNSIVLNGPNPLSINNVQVLDVACYGVASGAISYDVNGGTAPYLYSFDNGVNFQSIASDTLIAAGTYPVRVRDTRGCIKDTSILVASNPELRFSQFTVDSTSCYDLCDGLITLQISGGVVAGSYQLTWSQNANAGPSDLSANYLCEGSYSVIAEDDLGCRIDSLNVVLHQPSEALVDMLPTYTLPSCAGSSNGTITVASSNAYGFSIDGGMMQVGNPLTFSNLISGYHSIQAFDSNGCAGAVFEDFYLPEPAPLQVYLSPGEEVCVGTQVNVYASVAGGTAPYTYTWDNGESTASFDAVINSDTSFTLSFSDDSLCTQGPITVNYAIPSPLLNELVDQKYVCFGDTIQVATYTSGAVEDYYWSWSNGESEASFVDTIFQETVLYVDITDECGTVITDSVEILLHPEATPMLSSSIPNGCVPVDFTVTNAVGAELQDSIRWYVDGSFYAENTAIINLYFEDAGCHDIRIESFSDMGCSSDTLLTDFICFGETPIADFAYSPEYLNGVAPQVSLTNLSAFADTYAWDFVGYGQSNAIDPQYVFPEDESDNYTVCLEASNSVHGCTDTICKIIPVKDLFQVYVPNSFTADDNDMNEFFKPVMNYYSVSDYRFMIYDRWGTLVFHSINPEEGWDGKSFKSGVYVWKLEVTSRDLQESKILKGHVLLIK